jgi:glycosyltransferase involved in cell wall biosynthesis
MSAPLRVLHVVRGLANSSGTTHIVVPLSEEQARQGAKVAVMYVEKPPHASLEPDAGLVQTHCFGQTLPLRNPGVSLDFARAIDQRIREFDVLHVHAVWNFPTWWSMRAASRAGVPYMVAPQGSFEPWALGQNRWGKELYGRLTETPLLRRAAWLQALTPAEAAQFRQRGLETPIVTIPNGIDPRRFDRRPAQSLARRIGLEDGAKTLLFLSRLHPKKGLDVLVEAFAAVAAAHPEVILVVAGHDAGIGYAETLRASITRKRLESRCRLLGEVSGEDKVDILLGADVFVLPSRSEGLPVAVVEAMGAGLPVVITPGCNLPEVAEEGAGLIVSLDAASLARGLNEAFADPVRSRGMGERGRDLVRRRFTWEVIARQLLETYSGSAPRLSEVRA